MRQRIYRASEASISSKNISLAFHGREGISLPATLLFYGKDRHERDRPQRKNHAPAHHVGLWLQLHVFLVLAFCDAHTEENPLQFRLFVIGISVVLTLITLYCGHYATPRAYFSDEGVYLKRLIRKRFYPWGDIQQAVILERVGKSRYGPSQIYYQLYLLTSKGSPWIPGDTQRSYRWRNRRYLLLIPLTAESKEYVKLHHVKLAVDQSKGKRILWRGVK